MDFTSFNGNSTGKELIMGKVTFLPGYRLTRWLPRYPLTCLEHGTVFSGRPRWFLAKLRATSISVELYKSHRVLALCLERLEVQLTSSSSLLIGMKERHSIYLPAGVLACIASER